MVVISLVGATALTMLFATARATDATGDARKVALRAMTAHERLHREIIAARAVLAADDDLLVLWAHDDNESATVNLDELVLVERTSGDTSLRRWAIVWPDAMNQAAIDAANTEYAAGADFETTAAAMKVHAYAAEEFISTQAVGLAVTLKGGSVQTAKLVTIHLQLSVDDVTRDSYVVASLRSHTAPQ
jgi:hypothetical protein